ncbi:hypothetical protein ACIQD3_10220 [Peribacillus loiseleuriae]|uniref:hypothetical protein n=1 Tax=Peribacillus loiseleuriae TaxID=1679170 RepID=UPI0038253FF5
MLLKRGQTLFPEVFTNGEHLVRQYGKVHKMHISMAIKELEELGHLTKKCESEAKEDRRVEKKKAREQNLRKKERKLLKKERQRQYDYDDETFAFIARYTSNEFTYGGTHEEMVEINQRTREKSWLNFEECFNDIWGDLGFWFSKDYAEEMNRVGVQSRDHSEVSSENLLTGASWQSLLEEIEQTK